MLRMGFMPSDFHPILLVLGTERDLSEFAKLLSEFALDGKSRALRADGYVFSADTEVLLERSEEDKSPGMWPSADDRYRLHWRLTRDDAAAFAQDVGALASSGASAGSVTLECELLKEVKVKVSIGEWEDHFLEGDLR